MKSFCCNFLLALSCFFWSTCSAAGAINIDTVQPYIYRNIINGEEGFYDWDFWQIQEGVITPEGKIWIGYPDITVTENRITINPNRPITPDFPAGNGGDGFHRIGLVIQGISDKFLHYSINSELSQPGYSPEAISFNFSPFYYGGPESGIWIDLTSPIGRLVIDVSEVAPVPEPETYAMFLAGLGLIGAASRRRKQD